MILHPLDGARAKLERASEHIHDLSERVSEVIHEKCSATEEVDGDRTTFYFRTKATSVDLIPISVVAGEILYLLRSSLDHLMWQLVRRIPKDPRAQTQITFPIHKSAREYRSARIGMNVATIKGADALLEAAQPYLGAGNYADHWLWLLKELAKIDRHRLLIVVQTAASLALFSEDKWHGMTPPKRIDIETYAKLTILGAKPKVEMQSHPVFHVALHEVGVLESYPIGILVQLLAQATRATVESFAPLFPAPLGEDRRTP
jgi:hypothetical protein